MAHLYRAEVQAQRAVVPARYSNLGSANNKWMRKQNRQAPREPAFDVMDEPRGLLLGGDVLQDVEEVVPNHLDGGDVQTLVRRVDTTQGGAEADHVEVRVALGEEAALQTGMDATNHRHLAEELLVGIHHNLL